MSKEEEIRVKSHRAAFRDDENWEREIVANRTERTGSKDNTTPAMDIERPITDEVAAAIAKEAEEYHKRKEREKKLEEASEAPITIYWRKAQDQKLYYEGMRNFDAAEWKKNELVKAGYIDIQIIVKGKKKEVIRK